MDTKPQQSKWTQERSTSILQKCNVCANLETTGIIIFKRDAVEISEKWRKDGQLGSLLGDEEDIINRKTLATAALSRLQKI